MQSLHVYHFISWSQKRDVLSKLLIASHIIFYFDGIRRFIYIFFSSQQSCYTRLYGEGDNILLRHSTHLHDRIMLLRDDVWDQKTS